MKFSLATTTLMMLSSISIFQIEACPYMLGLIPGENVDKSDCIGNKSRQLQPGRGRPQGRPNGRPDGRPGGRLDDAPGDGTGGDDGDAVDAGDMVDNGPGPVAGGDCNYDNSPDSVSSAIADAKGRIIDLVANTPILGPKFVRLGFHDCVGGCDGSVNLEDGDNAGLELPIMRLRPLVECFAPALTRADVWALAALTSAEFLQDGGPTYPDFVAGRPSRADDESGNGESMPSPHLTTPALLDFFGSNFGFDAQETVAIMGAHTLGRLNGENSGFNGNWVPDPTTTSNSFYQVLLDNIEDKADERFILELQGPGYLWRRGGGGGGGPPPPQLRARRELQGPGGGGGGGGGFRMLNADMALASDFSGEIDGDGFVFCNPNVANNQDIADECPVALDTISFVVEYASNEGVWLNDFMNAMVKMTSLLADDLV